mmetsp:Transcript_55256/g.120861  ORF Transcript_55256/g.120861 Transcript_55256/m.120861 type:complete len:133 (+) Transcript_55256:11-409(+)
MYGMMLGNAISTADCARAFLQAFLLLEEEAFGHFKQPTVRLRKALYGHPLASAMWDRHLRRVLLVEMGLIAVEGHPSVFRDTATGGCPYTAKSTSGLLLVVQGPGGTFFPLYWRQRRQQHVARSTADVANSY